MKETFYENRKILSRNQVQKDMVLYLVVKRIMDVLLSIVGLLITLPVFFTVSFFYLYGRNKGPIFFKQERIGKNGKVFKVYKFRSMIIDAENVLMSNKLLYKKYLENNYKLEPSEDPRITKLGLFLRKTSIDELPQLLNVLRGDMSIVGPRPVVRDELKEYSKRLNDFISVKPGVTGYWQICGRSDVGYPERAELEFYYIDNQGIKLDINILFKTILLVLLRKGAY